MNETQDLQYVSDDADAPKICGWCHRLLGRHLGGAKLRRPVLGLDLPPRVVPPSAAEVYDLNFIGRTIRQEDILRLKWKQHEESLNKKRDCKEIMRKNPL